MERCSVIGGDAAFESPVNKVAFSPFFFSSRNEAEGEGPVVSSCYIGSLLFSL